MELKLKAVGREMINQIDTDLEHYRYLVEFTDKQGVQVRGDVKAGAKLVDNRAVAMNKLYFELEFEQSSKARKFVKYPYPHWEEKNISITYSYKKETFNNLINALDLRYKKADILNAINIIAGTEFKSIEVVYE